MKVKIPKKPFNTIWSTFVRIGSNTLAQFFILIIVLLAVNIISQDYFLRIDITENKIYTLSSGSKNILGSLEEPVTIKTYFSENLPPDIIPVIQDTNDIFNEYVRYANGNVKYEIQDPNSEDFKTNATEAGIPEIQFSEFSSDKFEIAQGFLGAAIEYKGETEVIPVVTNVSNLEYETSSRIYKLSTDEKPTIGFLSGHGEKGTIGQYSSIQEALEVQFEVEEVSTEDGQPIDAEKYTALVIGGPAQPFTERELFEIDQYIMNGGRVVVLADLYQLAYQQPALNKVETNINDLLVTYGVEVKERVLLDESFLPLPSGITQLAYPYWVRTQAENMENTFPPLNNLESLVFFWANPLEKLELDDNQSYTALIKTTDKAWIKVGADSISVDIGQFSPIDQQQYTIAALVEGTFTSQFEGADIPPIEGDGEDQRSENDPLSYSSEDVKLVVIGDSDFVSDQLISGSEQNATFFINLIEWLASNEDLISIRSKNVTQRPLEIIGEGERWFVKAANVGLVPVLLIGLGIGYNVYRKKKGSSI